MKELQFNHWNIYKSKKTEQTLIVIFLVRFLYFFVSFSGNWFSIEFSQTLFLFPSIAIVYCALIQMLSENLTINSIIEKKSSMLSLALLVLRLLLFYIFSVIVCLQEKRRKNYHNIWKWDPDIHWVVLSAFTWLLQFT